MIMKPDKASERTTLLIDLQYKSSAKAQERAISDLWQHVRDDLELLKQEHIVLKRDTSKVVEWLKQEARDWQQTDDDCDVEE